jgi:hypothetical protein
VINLRDEIINEYFEWLYDIVCGEEYSKEFSYRKLLTRLHDTEFRYLLKPDQNRADDGIDLRYRFIWKRGYDDRYDQIMDILAGPCSVLEMMIALSIRCEENIMDDPNIGDRTAQWFWGMVINLGLGSMMDGRFDRDFVDESLDTFLDRRYAPDGTGGLFTIDECDRDLRSVEIWNQLCWYLDNIV